MASKIQLAKYEDVTAVNTSLTNHTGNKSNPHGVTKSQVGLGNVTNVATESTITSGSTKNITSGAVYTHTSNKSNPHEVTKAQVGLGSVVNTGDSATPVSGGTTKFTTGGAYTELNKKVDKTTTVNGHALSDNVTVTKSDVGLGNVLDVASYSKTEVDTKLADYLPLSGGTMTGKLSVGTLESKAGPYSLTISSGYLTSATNIDVPGFMKGGYNITLPTEEGIVALTKNVVAIDGSTSMTGALKVGSSEYANGSWKMINGTTFAGTTSYEASLTIPGYAPSTASIYPGKLKLINKMSGSADSNSYTTTITLPRNTINLNLPNASGTILTHVDGNVRNIAKLFFTDTGVGMNYIETDDGLLKFRNEHSSDYEIDLDVENGYVKLNESQTYFAQISPSSVIIKDTDDNNCQSQLSPASLTLGYPSGKRTSYTSSNIKHYPSSGSSYVNISFPTSTAYSGKLLTDSICSYRIVYMYSASSTYEYIEFHTTLGYSITQLGPTIDIYSGSDFFVADEDYKSILDCFPVGWEGTEGNTVASITDQFIINSTSGSDHIYDALSSGYFYPAQGSYNGKPVVGVYMQLDSSGDYPMISTARVIYHDSTGLHTAVSYAIRNHSIAYMNECKIRSNLPSL